MGGEKRATACWRASHPLSRLPHLPPCTLTLRPPLPSCPVLETTPAHSPLMRLFSALATSRLLRRPLLSFYASVSGEGVGGMVEGRRVCRADSSAKKKSTKPRPSANPSADHTRRLVSISANAKFAGPSTGPASSLSVRLCA